MNKGSYVSIFLALVLLCAVVTTMPVYQIREAYAPVPEFETLSIPVTKDSFLTQGSQTNNEGNNIILDLQSSDKRRPVVAFDQNQITNAVNGRQVESATLQLYVIDNGNNWGSDGNTIGAHRLVADWQEGNGWNVGNNIAGSGSGVTWACAIDSDISNNQNDCATQWNGGSFQNAATSGVLITNNVENQLVEFDVTSDVQAFLSEAATNYGWLIKKTSESLNGDIVFASKEASTNSPLLQVTVINPEAALANEYFELTEELDAIGTSLDGVIITQAVIDDINATLTRVKEVAVELQNLGYDGNVTTQRVGQRMVATVTFYDGETLETLFESQIQPGTLGVFFAMGLSEEYAEHGIDLTFEDVAGFFESSVVAADMISNFEDDKIASDFILASVLHFHPSTGHSIGPAGIAISVAFLFCLNNIFCRTALIQVIQYGFYLAAQFAFPLAHITGLKFYDENSNGNVDVEDYGLSNWNFTMYSSENGFFWSEHKATSDSNGHFDFGEIYFARFITNFVIFESLPIGWKVTTPGSEPGSDGEVQSVPFQYQAINFNFQPREWIPFEEHREFGNHPTTLTVIKNIVNDDGGTLDLSGVTLRIDNVVVQSGEEKLVPPGSHTVSEDPVSGYMSTISGDCGPDGSVTLSLGENRVCIITNNDEPPTIPGLVGYWKFDEVSGTSAADSSGNGNTGTLFNEPTRLTAEKCVVGSGCLDFDGTDDSVSVSRSVSIEPSNAITITMWVNASAAQGALIDKAFASHTSPFYSYNLQLEPKTGQSTKAELIWGLNTNGAITFMGEGTSEVLIDLNQWQFIAVTYDGSQMKEYVNGQLIRSVAKTGAISYYDKPLLIGKYNNIQFFTNAMMDDVRVYNKALTSSEIQQLFQEDETTTLTVIKNIVNDDGGTLTLSGVTLKMNDLIVSNGTANVVSPGAYVVSETLIGGYISTISGDCAPDGSVTLALGDNKVCVITNDDEQQVPTDITFYEVTTANNGFFIGNNPSAQFHYVVGERFKSTSDLVGASFNKITVTLRKCLGCTPTNTLYIAVWDGSVQPTTGNMKQLFGTMSDSSLTDIATPYTFIVSGGYQIEAEDVIGVGRFTGNTQADIVSIDQNNPVGGTNAVVSRWESGSGSWANHDTFDLTMTLIGPPPPVTVYNVTTDNNGRAISGNFNHVDFDGEQLSPSSILIGKKFNKITIKMWCSWVGVIGQTDNTGTCGGTRTGGVGNGLGGTAYLGIWDSSINPTSTNYKRLIKAIDPGTELTETLTQYTFTMPTSYTFAANDVIGLLYAFDTGNPGDWVSVRYSTSDKFDGTNTREGVCNPNCGPEFTQDITMTLVNTGG